LEVAPKRRRTQRGAVPPLGRGSVFGFDELPLIAQEAYDSWQADDNEISIPLMGPARRTDFLPSELETIDVLAPLRALLDPSPEMLGSIVARPTAAPSITVNNPVAAQLDNMLVPQAEALAPTQLAPEVLERELPSATAGALRIADGLPDPFRPYDPQPPPEHMQGACAEITAVFHSKPADAEDTQGALGIQKRVKYDQQTAQVDAVLRRALEGASGRTTLDDVIPPTSTQKDIAARMFGAILTLATAGDLKVEQSKAYGPIEIAVL